MLAQYIREKGFQRGLEKGMEKGMEKGIKKGVEKGVEKVARKLIKMGVSIEQIVEATGLSPEEIKSQGMKI
ncbi:hypothetical protein GMMP15_260027 [Candidatus Magnetomoraceae bacterium gMMP-15]